MTRIIIAALVALVVGGSAWAADFQKGLDLYNKKEYATALSEWEPLAEQGNVDAQFYLGLMYQRGQLRDYKGEKERGEDARQNYNASIETSIKWYTMAAEQGHVDAQFALADIYRVKDGINSKIATKWLIFAAEQGHVDAQDRLGWTYYRGKGVVQDYKSAIKWFTLAAEQGHADAQYKLGLMYWVGHGFLRDFTRAHMWINVAASNLNPNAVSSRDALAGAMSPSQIETAQRLARECVAKDYKGCGE